MAISMIDIIPNTIESAPVPYSAPSAMPNDRCGVEGHTATYSGVKKLYDTPKRIIVRIEMTIPEIRGYESVFIKG